MDKKIIFIIAIIVVVAIASIVLYFVLRDRDTSNYNTTNGNETNGSTEEEENEEVEIDYKESAERQMAMPEEGEEIAIMHIRNFGEIKIRFFPEVAPKAVENFVTHARNGYYDGLTFHRVIEEFMIQGGDPLGNGTGGESIWERGFEEEFGEGAFSLVPYRGSLAMASRGLRNI